MTGFFLNPQGRLRKGWLLLLFGCVLYTVSSVLWMLMRALGMQPSFYLSHGILAAAALAANLALLRLEPSLDHDDPLLPPARPIQTISLYVLWSAAIPAACAGVLAPFGDAVRRAAPLPHFADALSLGLPGASEELLVRGVLLLILVQIAGRPIALVSTSALFGLLHFWNPNANAIAILIVSLSGLLFGLVVLRTRSIWPAVLAHAAWNISEGFVLGLPVSGIEQKGALLPLALKGPTWLSGGAFGPEASVITLAVLAASCVALVLLPAKQSHVDRETV